MNDQTTALAATAEASHFDRMGWINEAMRLALEYREASTAAANRPYLALLDHLKSAGMHWQGFTFLRNKEAAAQSAPAAPPGPQGMTADRHFVLREAHAIGASDAYFKAWPTHDNDAGRMLFERGFVRGFDCGAELPPA